MKVKLIEVSVGLSGNVYESLEEQLNNFCKYNDVISIQILERRVREVYVGLAAYVCYNEKKHIDKLNQKVLDQIEMIYG